MNYINFLTFVSDQRSVFHFYSGSISFREQLGCFDSSGYLRQLSKGMSNVGLKNDALILSLRLYWLPYKYLSEWLVEYSDDCIKWPPVMHATDSCPFVSHLFQLMRR